MTHLLSRENEPELCLFAGFQAIEFVGRPVLKSIEISVCEMNVQGVVLSKTQHSRVNDNTSDHTLIPSFHGLRYERLGP